MKPRISKMLLIVIALPAVNSAARLAAQDATTPVNKAQHHHYKFIDLGTLGGPNSFVPTGFFADAGAKAISNQGTVTGAGDTSIPDPLCFIDDCFYPHAFRWKNGAVTDLGALPGAHWSIANWISANGLIAGISTNGDNDPLLGLPEGRAVVWEGNSIVDLGTLPGGYESFAWGVNNRGQVVGNATNGTPDPYSYYYQNFGISNGGQSRAFVWDNRNGMQDLGTLGGPDAWAAFINDQGQIGGISLTSFTPNSDNGPCAPNVPGQNPFFWDSAAGILDVGTLGGTCGVPNAFNNRGQMVGQSFLTGNLILRAFLWDRKSTPPLLDLGTLGGDNASALWIDDAGAIVGYADVPNPPGCKWFNCVHHAFLWKDSVMTDLGSIGTDPCSRALSVNSKGQVVGFTAAICGGNPTHGFLWENGGPAIDLKSIIHGADVVLAIPHYINARGDIAGNGVLSNGDNHAFLLIPCDENHPDIEGCDYGLVEEASYATVNNSKPLTQAPVTTNPKFSRGPSRTMRSK